MTLQKVLWQVLASRVAGSTAIRRIGIGFRPLTERVGVVDVGLGHAPNRVTHCTLRPPCSMGLFCMQILRTFNLENGLCSLMWGKHGHTDSSQVADETYLPIYVRTDIVEVQDSQKQWVGRQRTATIPLDRRKQKRRRFVIFR